MSYEALQKGTVLIIRHAQLARSEAGLNDLLGDLELTPTEREQLVQLAADPLVQKFGGNMSTIRRDVAFAGAPLTRRLYGIEALRAAYEVFDQSVTRITLNDVAYAFLEFLHQQFLDQEDLDGEACPWAPDVVAYERRQAELRCYQPPFPRQPAAGSALRHGDFRVLHLKWNIPAWEQKARVIHPDEPLAPQPQAGWYLLLKHGDDTDVRAFAIDEATARYLQSERRYPGAVAKPDSYGDLAAAGLVFADGPAVPRQPHETAAPTQ